MCGIALENIMITPINIECSQPCNSQCSGTGPLQIKIALLIERDKSNLCGKKCAGQRPIISPVRISATPVSPWQRLLASEDLRWSQAARYARSQQGTHGGWMWKGTSPMTTTNDATNARCVISRIAFPPRRSDRRRHGGIDVNHLFGRYKNSASITYV